MNAESFETERLLLPATSERDAAFLLELMNTPKWMRYIGDRHVHSVESASEYIQHKIISQQQRLGYSTYTMIRKEDQRKIGTCGLYDREGVEGIDIGFALLPEYENQGYALEASQRIVDAAFSEFGLSSLHAITVKANRGSQNLLHKLGMTLQGPVQIPGDTSDLLLYRLNR